jgi:hypothetical protein
MQEKSGGGEAQREEKDNEEEKDSFCRGVDNVKKSHCQPIQQIIATQENEKAIIEE